MAIFRHENKFTKGTPFPASVPAYTVIGPKMDGIPSTGHNAAPGDSVTIKIGKRRRIRRIRRVSFEGGCRCNCPHCSFIGTLTLYFE